MLTQAIHQYNKKNVEYDYTHVYILNTKILQWCSCSTIYAKMFIKILWAHTGYIMYKYDLRTFSITLNFDIKNSMYKILMVNGNENIQTKN